jgi:hypothetical protein
MTKEVSKSKPLWLVYLALALAGLLLIGDALNFHPLAKLTTRLGAGLIFAALALIMGKDSSVGVIATAIVWIAIIITFFS